MSADLGVIGSSDMSSNANFQKGFTLIEALVAFVVLSVGLLGASIFHSTLLKESADAKVRLEANSILEGEIEKVRVAVAQLPDATNLSSTISNAISTSVSSTIENYEIEISSAPTVVSGAGSLHEYELTIKWPQGVAASEQSSLVLKSYIGWSNQNTADASGVDLSGAASGYEGSIPVPTGTLTALERKVLDVSDGTLVSDNGEYKVYSLPTEGDNDVIVGIEIDGDFIQLAKLNAEQNELFSITGRIINDSTYPTPDAFGCTYSGATAGESGSVCTSASATEGVIDVGATGGAGCIIYDYQNDGATGAAVHGDYLCIAGTGWNGQISLRIMDLENSGANDTQEPIDGLVCSPELRGYKYVILEPSDPDLFAISVAAASTSSARRSLLDSVSVAGQSGLVRFYNDSDTNKSDEGVFWSNYFWHNPDYIENPVNTDFSYTIYDTTILQYSGDVGYQNFFVFKQPNGGSPPTCANYAENKYQNTLTGNDGYLTVASQGFPGWSYTPTGFDSSFYNDVQLSVESGDDQDKGVLILGYTLARFSVSGTLYVEDGSGLAASDFTIVGNPEPVVSINCDIDSTGTVTGNFVGYPFRCGVPTSWVGSLLAYATNITDATPCIASLGNPGFEEASDPDNASFYYFYNDVLGAPVSGAYDSADFDYLSALSGLGPITDSSIDNDFYFWTSNSSYCP